MARAVGDTGDETDSGGMGTSLAGAGNGGRSFEVLLSKQPWHSFRAVGATSDASGDGFITSFGEGMANGVNALGSVSEVGMIFLSAIA